MAGVLPTVLLTVTMIVAADAVIVAVGKRSAQELAMLENLPDDCDIEVDVEKRDSPLVDFVVCLKQGATCTSRHVPECTGDAKGCNEFDAPVDEQFATMFPNAYAEVCVENSGEQCLYTDIDYSTCSAAKAMGENEICITLSNGEVECAEIPDEYVQMLQSTGGRLRVSNYHRQWPASPGGQVGSRRPSRPYLNGRQ